ncbi:DUF3025 domain-containing protein [Glaciecola sp. 2405UD65-10]|uniref:DUF3025 domain-containing protein n=1 Tax=Glaciecola sp. 2405UD65-10 TaxID=3397244 RepID=UPI003B598A40
MSISHPLRDESHGELANTLSLLKTLCREKPFDKLSIYLESCLGGNWHTYELGEKLLNTLVQKSRNEHANKCQFISQSQFENNALYYEEIIYKKGKIPTRNNWHDFFNGLIWLQLPKTKRYFSEVHNQQIEQYGLKMRSPVRDRITHFDECGLIIFTNEAKLAHEIKAHNWQAVFINRKHQWHNNIVPIIVGHALWEMLLKPFIGLTAKVKVICLPDFSNQDICNLQHSLWAGQASSLLDELCLNGLKQDKDVYLPKPWMPLPLLGIPTWSTFTQDEAFYANQDYFMPRR